MRKLLLLAILLPTLAFSAEWYIDWVNGSDATGDGSFGSPWKTFLKSMGQNTSVDPGDTVWARAGTYVEGFDLDGYTVRNGTAENLIYWKEYSEEEVIFQGYIRCRFPDNGTNWCFDGWEIDNNQTSGSYGWRGTGNNTGNVFEFRNMTVDSCGACGIETGYSSNTFGTLRIINCDIYGNGKNKGSQAATGVYTAAYGTIEIEDSRIWDNGDSSASYVQGKGISIAAAGSNYSTGHVLRTVIKDNIESGLDWTGPDSEISYCQFYGNGRRDTEEDEWGDGNCKIHEGSDGTSVHHNLLVNPGRYNLEILGDSLLVYNNTMIDTLNYGLQDSQDYKSEMMMYSQEYGCIIKNNILVNRTPYEAGDAGDLFVAAIFTISGADSGYETSTIDYNCYYCPESPSANDVFRIQDLYTLAEAIAAFGQTTNDANSVGTSDPSFADADSAGFNLSSGSPCIDTGEDTITLATVTFSETILTGFNGDAPDMGWKESEEEQPEGESIKTIIW